MSVDWEALGAPFPAHDIEWRLTPGSVTKKGSMISARCLAYVTSRAIQERLDDVCGPDGWTNDFVPGPDGGVLCGISILVGDVWITKWDGAENTDIEPIKGGLSSAMKRAGSQWNIGRYLYYLPDGWAVVNASGRFWAGVKIKVKGKTEKEYVSFKWDNPNLPSWALPGGEGRPPSDQINEQTGEVTNSQMECPSCSAPLWDYRAEKARGNSIGDRRPDLACSNASCTGGDKDRPWAVWIKTWSEFLYKEITAAHAAEWIDAKQRDVSEEIVGSGAVEMMVRIQARLNEKAQEIHDG